MAESSLRILSSAIFIISIAFMRFIYITTRGHLHRRPKPQGSPSHMVVVLGSGGHTAEMMSLLRNIDPRRYIHRTYIVSSGDKFSSGKALEIETTMQARYHSNGTSKVGIFDPLTGTWDVNIVPRARKIHQSLYTTPFSSLSCTLGCMKALHTAAKSSKATANEYPDVIVTNGPATGVMVIIAAMALKFFGVSPLERMKIVYVESWARVKTLSLSGRLLLKLGVCDRFLVQWETLARSINKDRPKNTVEWVGFLVE